MSIHTKIGEGDHIHKAPAMRENLAQVVAEYWKTYDGLQESLDTFNQAEQTFKSNTTFKGVYFERCYDDHRTTLKQMQDNLLGSAWRYVYKGLQINELATTDDKSRWDMFFKNPPTLTLDNIREHMGDYIIDPRSNILRGLAETFCKLDMAYKSHDKVKVGVKGLPKRIIVSGFSGWSGHGKSRIGDIFKAMNLALKRPAMGYSELADYVEKSVADPQTYHGMTLKIYMNGNGHLSFDKGAQLDINRLLAEYYGDVLADSPEAWDERPKKQGSTEVSKDLAFYPTPKAAMQKLFHSIDWRDASTALEPSCGDGAIMDAIRAHDPSIRVVGVEVDPKHAKTCMDKRHNVHIANFLEVTPTPKFDLVIMNPPFAGKHYQKHVEHAKKFLKAGGRLYAILPATALYDHDYVEGPKDRWNSAWQDLPVGSFAESGTNVPTGIYNYINKAQESIG